MASKSIKEMEKGNYLCTFKEKYKNDKVFLCTKCGLTHILKKFSVNYNFITDDNKLYVSMKPIMICKKCNVEMMELADIEMKDVVLAFENIGFKVKFSSYGKPINDNFIGLPFVIIEYNEKIDENKINNILNKHKDIILCEKFYNILDIGISENLYKDGELAICDRNKWVDTLKQICISIKKF